MTILSNDDAHGVVGFANSSRSIIVSEQDTNVVVSLDVERNRGTFGQVSVTWELSGEHLMGEITPSSGQVKQLICVP